ncbi:MAG TPA: molybdopterin oxidoreductase, partial [Planctomycetes bacterium]|nr:molybdopterin oxidoreductase [Planctomycetota bacterium]
MLHMPSLNDNESKAYWRSLNDLADTDEFREMVAKEFPQQLDAVVDPVSRRRFVQLMGASLALAGLTGCDFMRWPKEKVLPYSRLPDERLPGKPVEYATTMELGGVGTGLLVKSYDGRPIKVEGNDLHPESLGATNGFAQASLLNLYDPDRSKVVRRKGSEEASSWSAFRKDLGQRMKKAAEDKGDKVVILSEATSSPTVAHLREQLSKRYKQLRWWDWEPVSRENELSEVPTQVLDGRYRVHFDLRRTDVIVSLDDDLFEAHPAALRLAREFADRRRRMDDERTMNRLYQIESGFTPTGSLADVRVPLQAGQILHFGLHLA